MCGRVFVRSSVDVLMDNFAFARRLEANDLDRLGPRFNGAPGLEYPIIVQEPEYPGGMFMLARWGFIPYWAKEPRPQINATCERVAKSGMFRDAYFYRRALMPIMASSSGAA